MKRSEVDINKLSPMMRLYVETKQQYEGVILFYRLGDFYEMFFEDAQIASHELELTLTGKQAGLDERIPMCGIPYHALESYLNKLVDKGYKVAICEQMEDPKEAKGIVKREVIQVVTKGTNTFSSSIDSKDLNYVASVADYKVCYALSYADILSGKIYTTYIPYNKEKLISYIVNLNIKELILQNENIEFSTLLKDKYSICTSIYKEIDSSINEGIFKNIEDIKLVLNTKVLLSYLINTQKRDIIHFEDVELLQSDRYLFLDKECVRNLELLETLRNKDKTYSLYWFLDKCKTAPGSRLLKNYIICPLINKEEIIKRHDVVEKLINEFLLTNELRNYLYEIYDLERLCGKVSLGTACPRDLLQLKNSIKVLPLINDVLTKLSFQKVQTYEEIYDLLEKSINEDASFNIKEGYIIKEGYNDTLDELRDIRKNGKDYISAFEADERERTKIKSLKVGFNKVFGYYIEISKGQIKDVKDEFEYTRKQTLSNCERFITPLLKEKEDLILGAEEKINKLEYTLFCEIRDSIKKDIHSLQKTASYISYLDVMQSFALISEENGFVRPIISDNHKIDIRDGFHPVVKKVLKDQYIPNDIIMSEKENILIITGPNMSGKSTYMRQLGVCSIINQIGCFVPATSAIMPVFDKIFTRIGASDDLVGGESTFMVEMKESASAIKNATENSLILFDELGRGTSTYDGMSLAGAIIKYISNHIKCKTLFSTHYHELTSLEKNNNGIKNVHVSIYEEDGDIKFLHKIKEGSVDKSYGINVAKLASLPKEVIEDAKELLEIYENEDKKEINTIKQISFDLEEQKDELREYIKNVEPLNLTPMQAINVLYEIKNKSN